MINEGLMNVEAKKAFRRLSNLGFFKLCQDQLSGVLQECC